MRSTQEVFKPRARIMLQLGDQLIRNESIALLELIKNSYDADTNKVDITLSNIDSSEHGIIEIKDDGSGMDFDIVRNVWMEPGNDYKEKQFLARKRSPKYSRLPLGEKGIGRFGVHKLGNNIELVTRQKGKPEVYLEIDWNIFNNSKYLDDIPIKIQERKPVVFEGNLTGTRIVIRDLRTGWKRGTVRDIHRSLNSMCSPFGGADSFKVNLNLLDNEDWLKGLISWKEIKNYALYKVKCSLDGDKISKFRYKFTPWSVMPKLEPRLITEKDEHFKKICKMVRTVNKKDELPDTDSIDLSKFKIGKVEFEALIFDRTPKILSLAVNDKKGFKNYLKFNGGIRVYRDGVRVYDYGEPGNDWLDLDIRRVNVPSKRISNNLIIGAIHLKRDKSESLIEKTNREGFIENEAYHTLCEAILYSLDKIETFRNPDKEKLQILYGSSSKSEPVLASIEKLRNTVKKRIKDEELREELEKNITRIETDYKFINETLLKGAGAGLGLSIVIHEIEKIIGELNIRIKDAKIPLKIVSLSNHLAQLVDGYTYIIRGKGRKNESLVELIDQALFNIEYRIRLHNLNTILDYNKPLVNPKVKCSRRFVISSVMNIMDNTIWWLNYYEIRKKKIYITISEELPGYTSIIMADNGKGFSLPTEEIIKPFMSGKPDDSGMGIGLHIVNESMKAQKGMLLFPELGDFSIPNEFADGAITALCFKN